MSEERVQKVLAGMGFGSRREIERWMEQENVLISRWQTMLSELHASSAPDFAMFAVANRELLDLAQSSLN